jgi:hypothetical protein
VDAVSQTGSGLLLSFDVAVTLEGTLVEPEDIVEWIDGGPPTATLFFDGSAQGVPAGLNLDAASYLGGDTLLLSFDTSASVGGAGFHDDGVVHFDLTLLTWELALDTAFQDLDWVGADLDALYVTDDSLDNCRAVYDLVQADEDSDNLGDLCDANLGNPDADSDGYCDGPNDPGGGACPGGISDNCPADGNPSQTNSDALPAGDACQCGDVNTDFVVNGTDVQLLREYLMEVTPLSGPFDPTRCSVIGLATCDVSDIFVLQRYVGGEPVAVENACTAYFGP